VQGIIHHGPTGLDGGDRDSNSLGGTFYIPAKNGGGNLVSRPAGRFLVSGVFCSSHLGRTIPRGCVLADRLTFERVDVFGQGDQRWLPPTCTFRISRIGGQPVSWLPHHLFPDLTCNNICVSLALRGDKKKVGFLGEKLQQGS
jgi:hypothetical protein